MKLVRPEILVALLAVVLASGATQGKTVAVSTLSVDDQHAVGEVVDYLQHLTNAKSRFVQISTPDRQVGGMFYLQRPGRARFDYDPPSGLTIASNGSVVSEVDRRLKTIHTYPLGATPLALFLARDIRLDRGVVVTQVTHGQGTLTVVAQDGRRAFKGRIALTFAETPLALTGWSLTDGRGRTVKVELSGLERSDPQPSGFFRLSDPRSGAPQDPSVRSR